MTDPLNPLRLIGLDLSLTSPGYAWTTPSGVPRVDIVTVPARDDDPHRRVYAVVKMIETLLSDQPHLVIIEDIFVGPNSQTAIKLAKLHGVVEFILGEARVPWVRVNPQHRAMYATGRGDASKELVLSHTRYTYGRVVGGASRIRTTDDADALILVAMAADKYGHALVPVDGTKRRALAEVKWPNRLLVTGSKTAISSTPPTTVPTQAVANTERTRMS